MKFLCENCKAKYQIADDKVAGRTVRRKCRKWGHLIEVPASVTETSVASKMPQESAPGLPPAGPMVGSPAPAGALVPPPRPLGSPGRATPPPRPPGPAPRTPPPPKPAGAQAGGLAGAFSKAVVAPP